MNSSISSEIIEAKERLMKAKARMHYAQKRAGEVALLAHAAEKAYVGACHELRERERELELLSPSKWRLWKAF